MLQKEYNALFIAMINVECLNSMATNSQLVETAIFLVLGIVYYIAPKVSTKIWAVLGASLDSRHILAGV
jgi:hypothetical protein